MKLFHFIYGVSSNETCLTWIALEIEKIGGDFLYITAAFDIRPTL